MFFKIGFFFFLVGTFLVSLSVYFCISTPEIFEIGFFVGIIMTVFDEIILLFMGLFFLFIGQGLMRGIKGSKSIKYGGQLFIFILITFMSSLLFNIYATPKIASNLKIFTYIVQSISRVLNPSISLDFLIPVLSFVVFLLISTWYNKYFIVNILK